MHTTITEDENSKKLTLEVAITESERRRLCLEWGKLPWGLIRKINIVQELTLEEGAK